MGGGRWESGERSEVQARSTLTSTAPKARPRSGEVATLDEVPRILLRVSSKLPSSPSSLLSSVITALARTSAYPRTTAAFARTLKSSIFFQFLCELPTQARPRPRFNTCFTIRGKTLASAVEAKSRFLTRRRWNRSDPTINIDLTNRPVGFSQPTDEISSSCQLA